MPRAAARILQAAGVEFGLMREQWCCGGPAAEMGYVDRAREFAQHNVDDWRAVGARRIIVFDPHDYISFTEDYPRYFGDEYDFEIVLLVELLAELIRDGRLPLTRPVERAVTYHDACRLNKRKGIHEAPREVLRAIPGPDLQGRRPRHPVVVLLGRRRRAVASSAPTSPRRSAGAGSSAPPSSASTRWSAPACGPSARCPSRAASATGRSR